MNKTAFLFPGQGSQAVGMGESVYQAFPEARQLFEQANDILGFNLTTLCFQGPEETLRQTQYTQPAIFVHSIVMDRLVKARGISPAAVAGHSLGEYSALVSAGAINFEDALRLVKLRGELMQHSGEKNPGTMAAIIGLDDELIAQICEEASEAGVVKPANFNSPGQVVISGSVPGVHRAMEIARDNKARMAKELDVSGAFHSPLMGDALSGLQEALQTVEIRHSDIHIYANVTAQPVEGPEEIRRLLSEQLTAAVQWVGILNNMINDGFQHYYETGPGKVLSGLLKRTNRDYKATAVATADELNQLTSEN